MSNPTWYTVVDPSNPNVSNLVLMSTQSYRDAYEFLLKEEGNTLSSLFIITSSKPYDLYDSVDLNCLDLT